MSATEERVFAGYRLGECVGRGGFGMVHRAFPVVMGADGGPPLCIKRGYPTWGGGRRMTRLVSTIGPPTSQGLYADEQPASALWYGTVVGVASVSAAQVRTIIADEYVFLKEQPPGLFPRVFERGEAEEMAYYVMEYIAGLNLRFTLRGTSAADRAALLARFTPLLENMRDRHAADSAFYHGDLKPDNIVVAGDRLWLIDPALRPISYTGADGYLTGSGPHTTITVAYNPLGVRGAQADTAALAITLFELLTGQQPFRAWDQPLWLDTGAIALDDHSSVQSFLDLRRFDPFRANPFLAQLLDWIAFPPPYAEMHAFLADHPDGAGEIDPTWQPIPPPIMEPPPFPVPPPPPNWLDDGPILPPVPMTLANQWLTAAKGRAIAVVCTDGSVQRGTLVAFDSESLQLGLAAGGSMLIARHTVTRLSDDNDGNT